MHAEYSSSMDAPTHAAFEGEGSAPVARRSTPSAISNLVSEVAGLHVDLALLYRSSFDAVDALDPVLAREMLRVFGDSDKASRWLCWDRRAAKGHSPLELISAGQRAEVLVALARIEHAGHI